MNFKLFNIYRDKKSYFKKKALRLCPSHSHSRISYTKQKVPFPLPPSSILILFLAQICIFCCGYLINICIGISVLDFMLVLDNVRFEGEGEMGTQIYIFCPATTSFNNFIFIQNYLYNLYILKFMWYNFLIY